MSVEPPGLRSAGSSISGLFVAAMIMTPCFRVEPIHFGKQLVKGLFSFIMG